MLKKIKLLNYLILIVLSLMIIFSCSSQLKKSDLNTTLFNEYYSTFNFPKSSTQINTIFNSVKFINSIAFYKTYFFATDSKIKNIDLDILKTSSVETSYDTKTASGTASIIYNNNSKLAFLTCAHIIDFPDTLYSYHKINDLKYIESVAIKQRQQNYINELIDGNKMEILVSDKEQDIAILIKDTYNNWEYSGLNQLFCDDGQIDIGTKIYIFGYPKGIQMVTTGNVGNIKENNYIVDSQFNRGQSGGMVFVTKSDAPNFELLGMAKSSAADFHLLLTPQDDYLSEKYNLSIPYDNNIYLKKYAFINYGLTNVIPINIINKFLKKNKKVLENNGYLLEDFFH
ncbi:MAG: hypothetical protein U9R41_03380 [Candidatus Marinimicrobia bacterium]|nr:hypothetical protein [Candidatus Neomarinimicrobiota bacterium]